MKYEQIDAERMNEYLSYMDTCLSIYFDGKDITPDLYARMIGALEDMRMLNLEMSKKEY